MEQVTHGWLARACEFKFTHTESTVCYRPPPFIDNQIVTGSSNGWPGSESPHHQLVSTMLSGAWDHSRPKHQFYIYGTVTSEGANHAKSLCRTGFQVNPLTQWLTRLGFYWQPIPYLAIGPHGSLGRASAGVSSTLPLKKIFDQNGKGPRTILNQISKSRFENGLKLHSAWRFPFKPHALNEKWLLRVVHQCIISNLYLFLDSICAILSDILHYVTFVLQGLVSEFIMWTTGWENCFDLSCSNGQDFFKLNAAAHAIN